MSTVRIRAVIQADGELHLTNLPCRKGDEVEAIVILHDTTQSQQREAARQRFLKRAQASELHSTIRYPTRDELHERG